MQCRIVQLGRISSFALAAGFLNIFCPLTPVAAQTAPSRVVPQSVAPQANKPNSEVILPENRANAVPAGADGLTVEIARIDVVGGMSSLAQETAALVDPIAGRKVKVSDLYHVAGQIEALYARKGYILTRATVPPQNLKDGSNFTINIVEGFIEAVDANALPSAVRAPLEKRLASLINVRGLTFRQIERQVLLAGRVPGVSLSTTIIPGQQIGGARLVLGGGYKAVQGAVSASNSLGKAYDNWSLDSQLVGNSLLGVGEQLYIFVSTASDLNIVQKNPLRRILGIGAQFPIGKDGLSLGADYIHADTLAKVPIGALEVAGVLDRFSLKAQYPVILSRQQSLNISGSFEVVNEHQSAPSFNIRLSEDRIRYLSLGLDWARSLAGNAAVGGDFSVSQGFDAFGARDASDALPSGVLPSRQGSKPDFSKMTGGFNYRYKLNQTWQTAIIVRGQTSFGGALPSAVQFALDGPQGLSGFASGSLSVDSGLTWRIEMSRAVMMKANVAAEPYVYAASASGNLSKATVLEKKSPEGWSIGGGMRAELYKNLRLSGEISRSHSNVYTKDQTRLFVSATYTL